MDAPAHGIDTMNRIADAINGDAADELSSHGAIAFAQAAKYCMADAILDTLPTYFEPLVERVKLSEVRRRLLSSPRHVATLREVHRCCFYMSHALALEPKQAAAGLLWHSAESQLRTLADLKSVRAGRIACASSARCSRRSRGILAAH